MTAISIWFGWIPNESVYAYGTPEALSMMQYTGEAYGQYQFDYRYGLVPFMQYCQNNFTQFNGFSRYIALGAGNSELVNNLGLRAVFTNYANNYTRDFLAAQNACGLSDYLIPAINHITSNYGYDIREKGSVVVGSLFSMAIRSGYQPAAQKYAGLQNASPLEIINTTYDTYGSQDAGRWESGTPISQRDKAISALSSGADVYSIDDVTGYPEGAPPEPPKKKLRKIVYNNDSVKIIPFYM